jgi:hypothetical protein
MRNSQSLARDLPRCEIPFFTLESISAYLNGGWCDIKMKKRWLRWVASDEHCQPVPRHCSNRRIISPLNENSVSGMRLQVQCVTPNMHSHTSTTAQCHTHARRLTHTHTRTRTIEPNMQVQADDCLMRYCEKAALMNGQPKSSRMWRTFGRNRPVETRGPTQSPMFPVHMTVCEWWLSV